MLTDDICYSDWSIQFSNMLKMDMRNYLVGIKLLICEYCLLVPHLIQFVCHLYTQTPNVRRLFSIKGI